MSIEIVENFRYNNDQTVTTEIGQFMVEQRNAGFVDNDGKWIVNQLPELFWSFGELRRRRAGVFLGAFETKTGAIVAIRNAQLQDLVDEPLR